MNLIGAMRYEPETPELRELRREAIRSDLAAGRIQIMGEWLVAEYDGCTCGAGVAETNYAHERGCGYEPLENLVELLLGPDTAAAPPVGDAAASTLALEGGKGDVGNQPTPEASVAEHEVDPNPEFDDAAEQRADDARYEARYGDG